MVGRKGIVTLLALIGTSLAGNPPCLDPISTVDWSLFVDKLELKGTCKCSTSGSIKVGLKWQLAEPIAFVEVPYRAWEFRCFGYRRSGFTLSKNDSLPTGDSGGKTNVHYIKYPVFGVLNITFDYLCTDSKTTSFDFLPSGMSEINPLIWDDELSILVQPWKLLMASPIGQIACLADCAATSVAPDSTEGLRNALFWCAGCWGTIAPDTTTTFGNNQLVESALTAVKILDVLHESLQLWVFKDVSGLNVISNIRNVAVSGFDPACQPFPFPVIVKSQYWMNLAYPSPGDAMPIGDWGLKWALMKSRPGEENFVWVVWRIRDCCVGFQFP